MFIIQQALIAWIFLIQPVSAHVCLQLGKIEMPSIALSNIQFITTVALDAQAVASSVNASASAPYRIEVYQHDENLLAETEFDLTTKDSAVVLTSLDVGLALSSGWQTLRFRFLPPTECQAFVSETTEELRVIPAALSLLPPLFTLVVAIATRHVILALYVGIWIGCLLLHNYNPITAFARSFDTNIPAALVDTGHAVVLLFSWMLAGMVAILG